MVQAVYWLSAMIWNICFWVVMLSMWLVVFWALLRRSSLGWNKAKTGAFNLSVFCFGFFLLFLFDITSCSLVPAEVQGRVTQLDVLNLRGTRCEFEVSSPDGFRVKLHSIVTQPFQIGDTLHVTYNPWRSEAYKVERLDGSDGQVLFDYRSQSGFYRARSLVDSIIVLLTVIGCIFCVRRFSLETPRLKP
jgi:hypothetical protein